MYIERFLEKQVLSSLESSLHPAILVYGPRQVGKTTLLKKIIERISLKTKFVACDDPAVKNVFDTFNIESLKRFTANTELLVLDEAQKVPQVGTILKLIIDYIPGVKILVSGSSSFELANQLSEPLTGRKITYLMYPVSLFERYDRGQSIELRSSVDYYLRFGLYPKIFHFSDEQSLEKLPHRINRRLLVQRYF